MKPERLLDESANAAPLTAAGTAELRKRVSTAETKLSAARNGLADCLGLEQQNASRLARIEEVLGDLAERKRLANLEASRKALAVLDAGSSDIATRLAEVRRATTALYDEGHALEEARDFVETERRNLSLKTLQAKLALNRAEKDWVLASAYADLHALHVSLQPALKNDPDLTLHMDRGSRASGYSAALNDLERKAVDLEKEFEKAREICQV